MGRAASRSQHAYEHIRRELLRGRWAVGDSVSAYALAEEIGVSRTPVVEALKRIEAEGLVEIVPQVGCRILAPSPSSIEELFGLRRALEGMAARSAAKTASDDDRLRIDGLHHRFEEAVGTGDRNAAAELDRAFHLAIAGAAGLGQVASMSEGVWSLLPARLAPPTDDDVADHAAIRAALRDGAAERARIAAERHVVRCAGREIESSVATQGRRPGFDHTALVYGDEDEFLAAATPFLAAGVAAGEQVLAVTGPRNRELLIAALGADADSVRFEDSAERYRTPGETLHGYQSYVADSSFDSRVRLLGEPIWEGRTTSEMDGWIRYESMLNVAFAALPVSILCPYAAADLDPQIIRSAHCTHPHVCAGGVTERSADYVSPLAFPG
jgi:DNA-binding GntR family transcriptional regulator